MNILPQQRRSNSDDNMIPLINIVFLLLIFFMVAGHIQKRPDASINIPTMKNSETPASLQHVIEINAQGILSMDRKFITPTQLADVLSVYKPSSTDDENTTLKLTLVVDQLITARQLEDVLSELRPLDHISVSMLVENRVGGEQR